MPSKNSIASFQPKKHKPVLVDRADNNPKIERITKGFRVDVERAKRWNMLVAKVKEVRGGKNVASDLIAEALDYLFEKYE